MAAVVVGALNKTDSVGAEVLLVVAAVVAAGAPNKPVPLVVDTVPMTKTYANDFFRFESFSTLNSQLKW